MDVIGNFLADVYVNWFVICITTFGPEVGGALAAVTPLLPVVALGLRLSLVSEEDVCD